MDEKPDPRYRDPSVHWWLFLIAAGFVVAQVLLWVLVYAHSHVPFGHQGKGYFAGEVGLGILGVGLAVFGVQQMRKPRSPRK